MNEFEGDQNRGTGVPQEGDEGQNSPPVQAQQPVDAPRHEQDDFDGVDVNAKESSADYDAEETNTKE